MKGWANKKACLEAAKSLRFKAWLNQFNVGVPCTVQGKARKGGKYFVSFHLNEGYGPSQLFLPPEALNVENKFFTHSVPLKALYPMLEILKDELSICDSLK